MQNIDGRGWIDTLDSESQCIIIQLADDDGFFAFVGQVSGNVIDRVHDSNIKLVRPITVGRAWNDVPVVVWLVVDKDRRLARRVYDV